MSTPRTLESQLSMCKRRAGVSSSKSWVLSRELGSGVAGRRGASSIRSVYRSALFLNLETADFPKYLYMEFIANFYNFFLGPVRSNCSRSMFGLVWS